ncbi:AMP-binding protein [Crenobacter intestini]|uniref:Long-chain-fatty-acid--CoA ligase n=1 Tax=Crenobacter intestini TaxID=2563443 RepID=A0A4T0V317_9NEIS|nr:AMP-binding protein [Crenobacter intestini]TIC86012.1 long-chain-fatty-acid--CoA ligase [Crenobacter intestini]
MQETQHNSRARALRPLEHASLGAMMTDAARRHPERAAFVNMGVKLSYRELDRQSAAFAAYLTGALRMKKGDRIALMMPNLLQYPVALYGALRAGLIVVNINPLYTPRELEHQLQDSGASTIVILENFVGVLQEVLGNVPVQNVLVTSVGDLLGLVKGTLVNAVLRHFKKLVPPWWLPGSITLKAALKEGGALPWRDPALRLEDIALLQYTGGTTGLSKGAVLTHGNVLSNLEQTHMTIEPVLEDIDPVVMASPLPLYHILALTMSCLLITRMGGTALLITNPRDLPTLIKDLARTPVNCMIGVNTLFNALANNPDFAKLDFSRWRLTVGGGTAILQAVAEKWLQVTGLPLIEGYGLTETSPLVCVNPIDSHAYTGTIGLPVPGTEVELRGPDGLPVADGEPGELCVRGPQVMKCYWKRPQETARVVQADGFLATGDIAYRTPEGYFKLVDRKKDMIIVSGFNVFPSEIEDVVALHPDVLEVACVGVPDPRTGEAVKLFVVRRDGALDADALLAYCRGKLTAYKVPREIEFREDLPRSNVGKILRRELRGETARSQEDDAVAA